MCVTIEKRGLDMFTVMVGGVKWGGIDGVPPADLSGNIDALSGGRRPDIYTI